MLVDITQFEVLIKEPLVIFPTVQIAQFWEKLNGANFDYRHILS